MYSFSFAAAAGVTGVRAFTTVGRRHHLIRPRSRHLLLTTKYLCSGIAVRVGYILPITAVPQNPEHARCRTPSLPVRRMRDA